MTSRLGPTIDGLLAERASTHAESVFLRFGSGDLTFSDVHRRAEALAGGLASRGVAPGEVVAVLLPNAAESVITWLALCRLGAVACMVNTAFKGPALRHALAVSGARLVMTHPTTEQEVAAIAPEVPGLARAVTLAAEPSPIAELETLHWSSLEASGDAAPPAEHRPDDPAMILFTSGTTGPSKGCVLPHRYTVRQAELMVEHLGLVESDIFYTPFPLFHIDATVLTIGPALVLGTTAAISERFSVSGFWPEVRRFGATVFDFMGATLTMLHKQERESRDGDNPARLAWGVPVPEFAPDFEDRFGLQLVELYGSTDVGVPIYHPVDVPRRPGSCGRAIDAYEVRLVDADGLEVGIGEVGEMVVRPNEPALMASGYVGMPEATLASRRNLWFHTGDLGRRDADGFFYFVGRSSESIRRRGENISAFEIEEVVKLHPSVLDAAAFGVPSELTEDDVMVAIVLRPGANFDPGALTEFCTERLARHMVPRYLDTVPDLPRTPTEKVRKHALRARGVTPTTWDRQRSR